VKRPIGGGAADGLTICVVIEMRNGEVLRVWDRKGLAVMETKGVRDGKPGLVLAMGRSP